MFPQILRMVMVKLWFVRNYRKKPLVTCAIQKPNLSSRVPRPEASFCCPLWTEKVRSTLTKGSSMKTKLSSFQPLWIVLVAVIQIFYSNPSHGQDIIPPTLVSASFAGGYDEVLVVYSEPMDLSATDPFSYLVQADFTAFIVI